MIDDAFCSPKKEIIKDIVIREWNMFQKVQGIDGRAACQDNFETFNIMRFSNFAPWPLEIIKSYSHDLSRAEEENRNLVLEKYGYMMSISDSSYYQNYLKVALPEVNAFMSKTIREIMAYFLECERQFEKKYPKISANGRKLNSSYLDAHFASIETYITGELRTYSPTTLRLLIDYIRYEKALGHNIVINIRDSMVRMYGYPSLDEAERKM